MAAEARILALPVQTDNRENVSVVQQDVQQNAVPAPARALRFAVPKKGRLQAAFAAVMAANGLAVEKDNARQDFGRLTRSGKDTGVEALMMRGYDALRKMAAGAADMTVVGLDMLREFNATAARPVTGCAIVPLGLAPCALYIAAPEGLAVQGARDLTGLRIATSFPGIVREWLDQAGVAGAEIVTFDGGVEDSVRLGLADVVCDLVETGTTLAANGLRPCVKVMDSEAVLVVRADRDDARLRAVAAQLGARAPLLV